MWIIENKEREYQSQGFSTKKEAIFRLKELINEPFYNCGCSIIRQANDFVTFSDNTTFRVIKFQSVVVN